MSTYKTLDEMIDEALIARGEHPTRVRNPLYGEERELAKTVAKQYATERSQASLDKAAENAEIIQYSPYGNDDLISEVDKSSITDPKNIILL